MRAVVSLPQEAFYSSGASVKCSLLFLQKFTEEEQQAYDDIRAKAKLEVEARYADEIESERVRLEGAIQEAKARKNSDNRKALQKELKGYLKEMETKQSAEVRQLLKERFDYPIFMYEAKYVGITSTGGEDKNELYPNDNKPADCEKTCLEEYWEFEADLAKYRNKSEVG